MGRGGRQRPKVGRDDRPASAWHCWGPWRGLPSPVSAGGAFAFCTPARPEELTQQDKRTGLDIFRNDWTQQKMRKHPFGINGFSNKGNKQKTKKEKDKEDQKEEKQRPPWKVTGGL